MMDNPNSTKGPDNPSTPLAASKASLSPLVSAKESLRKTALTVPSAAKTIGVNFSVGAICQSLRRRWISAFFLASLLMAGGVTAAWFALQPAATARAMLYIASSQPRIIFATADNTSTVRDDSVNYQRTQAILIRSRWVLNAALKKVPNLSIVKDKVDVLDWLDSQLQVDTNMGTEIIRVSLSGDEPQEIKTLLSAVVEAYMKEIVNKEHDKRLAHYTQLKGIYNTFDTALTTKRKALRAMESGGTGYDEATLAVTHKFNLEQLSNVNKQLTDCVAEIHRLKAGLGPRTSTLKTSALALPTLGDAAIANDIKVSRLRREVAEKQEKLERLKEKLEHLKTVKVQGADDPSCKKLAAEIAETKNKLDARTKELTDTLIAASKSRLDANLKEGAVLQDFDLSALQKLKLILETQIEQLTKNARNATNTSVDILTMRDEIAQKDASAKKINDEIEKLDVELGAPPRVTLLEPADIVGTNADRKRYMGMGGAAVFGLAFALFGVAWLDLRTCRLSSPDDLQGLGIRLVGSIPIQVKRPKGETVATNEKHDDNVAQQIFASSIDATRTMLLHAAQAHSMQVVMITSALSGEGKTSLACHLAASLAYTGRRVLLLDCDMRKPTVHKLFNLSPSPGFGSLLIGESMVEDVVQATSLEGLSVIVAGNRDDRTVRALARDRVKAVMSQLRDQYDFIIVDSCPVLPVADSLLIAPHVDAVVFSLLNDVSRMPAVGAAWKRLEALGTPMLGAVVSGVQEVHYGYHYGAR